MDNIIDKIIENRKIFMIYCSILIIKDMVHYSSYLHFRQTDFNDLFDTFESSPLFDFSIEDNCGMKSQAIFRVLEGNKGTDNLRSENDVYIKKLNGKFFCYKHISYKELLYNGQIRKKEEQYNGNFTYDCGIVDTLNQHLYIKDGEKCPLYDAGIGKTENLTYYNYLEYPYELYYNNDKYNNQNKRIIGKLILNDGQPCYKLNEKLWRQFDSEKKGKEHLKCELEIFGNFSDDKYKYKGDTTYNQIFKDNLSDKNYETIKYKLNDLKVSLYSREFLGINKTYDENSDISKNKYEKLKNSQEIEHTILFLLSFFIFIVFVMEIIFGIAMIFSQNHNKKSENEYIFSFYIIYFLIFLITMIGQSIFLVRIIYNNVSYNCSDAITNELFKKENENTKKTILYTAINLGLDIFIIFLNFLPILINYLLNKFKERKNLMIRSIYKKNDSANKDSEMEPIIANKASI